jgi:hypothetical protein
MDLYSLTSTISCQTLRLEPFIFQIRQEQGIYSDFNILQDIRYLWTIMLELKKDSVISRKF